MAHDAKAISHHGNGPTEPPALVIPLTPTPKGDGEGLATLALQLHRLTCQQRKTLDLLLRGHPERAIAQHLGVSPHTAHDHIKCLYRHFNVTSRARLMARFIIPLPSYEPSHLPRKAAKDAEKK